MSKRLATEELEMQLKELEARKKELEAKRKDEKKKMRPTKRGGLIVLCIILFVIVVGLSVVLLFSIKHTQDTVTELNCTIDELNTKMETSIEEYKKRIKSLEGTISALKTTNGEQQRLIAQYKAEVAAWEKKFINTDPEDATYSYSFNSVNSLLTAVQKNPSVYNNTQVKVVGTMLNESRGVGNDYLTIMDLGSNESIESTSSVRFLFWIDNKYDSKEMVDVVFADNVPSSLISTKNYVKLYGTVRIENGKVYLDNCKYEIIS